MLQIGEDVDYLLIPREVRLAGGVWRVISKPATKEAEFRERLTQFLEEEGRTLEDVARIIEKSTPHPPQPPKKPKEPRVRRRVQQVETPPPRLIVGTYDSSNASDSEFSDFETSRGRRGAEGPEGGPGAAGDHNAEPVADQRAEAVAGQGAGAAAVQRAEPTEHGREAAPTVEGAAAASDGTQATADQGAGEAAHQRAEVPAVQEAEASAAQGPPRAPPGARARKQVKTVRFQTPGRFSWFHRRRRAFWHTPRVPALPGRVPRAGEARSLRVLRAEARAEAEQGEQEDPL
ncbi:PREDICTED: coiled-coil domain-containing protein 8 [Condylura cristata]|uniref:coiled-coil domain-containing protein 8 n=1 Tax=Condylura cristata TaxID=143302 RepID=UPI000643CC2E|nr:PREDICTED: coiled-coil domain-containing protein 8 [Condylura cristata]